MNSDIIIVLIVAAVVIVRWHRKFEKEKRLKSFVAWCQSSAARDGDSLVDIICQVQRELNLPPDLRLQTKEEKTYASEILEDICDSIARLHFSENLDIPKVKPAWGWQTKCLMFWIQSQLEDHQCDFHYLSHDMHDKTISWRDYGSYGGRNFDATYTLSDFAVAFHKLYYISYVHNQRDKEMNPQGKYNRHEERIEKTIRNKSISITSY